MRPDKFTVKMQEALQSALDLTSKHGQQEIDNEHFLLALLQQSEGLARPLLEKMGVATSSVMTQLESQIATRSRVQGGAQPFVGNDLRKTIDQAEKEQEKLKDEYLSAEHYLLALSDEKNKAASFLKEQGFLATS